jgi:predicted CopG family antitoxin
MSDNKPKKVHRVQIDFSEEAYNQLLKLKEDDGTETVSSLIRNALGLYDWYLLEKKQGAEFLVRKNGEVEKISFNETETSNDS